MVDGRYRYLFAGVAVLAIGYLGYLVYSIGWSAIESYRAAANYANTEPIRTMILDGMDGLSVDAAVEPKTGDIYFPPAKLYVPASALTGAASYRYSWDDEFKELTVIDQQVYNIQAAPLYNARNVEELFQRVPKLQACARGVIVSPSSEKPQSLGDPELKQTVRLNGQERYVFIERTCQENSGPAERMTYLRSY